MSTYGVQLWEKQKLLYAYGVREKKQLQRYYDKAKKFAITGEGLLQLLESRLDNVVFRMGSPVVELRLDSGLYTAIS